MNNTKDLNLPENIKLNYQLKNLSKPLQNDIKTWIENKINKLTDSYFKSILKKQDAEIHINVKLAKNQKKKYNGNFKFNLDGDTVLYQRNDFDKIKDLIDNAFDHLTTYMGDNK